MKTKAIHI